MKNIKKINLLFLTFVISNNYVFFNNNRIQCLRNYGKFYMQKYMKKKGNISVLNEIYIKR